MLALTAPVAMAAPPPRAEPVKADGPSPQASDQKRVVRDVTFGRIDRVEVERLEPDAETLEWLKKRERASLIRLRWHFVPQIVRSADQL